MANPCPDFAVTTPFGKPGSWSAGYHTGDDYACPAGTRIVAAAAGHVIRNIYDESYGWMVELETEGIRHRYCHLRAQSSLAPGAWIGAGSYVGDAGSTGNSTGNHLHYEERVSPWGYWDHREPQFNHETGPSQPPEEEDMALTDEDAQKVAWAVWSLIDEATGYSALTTLRGTHEQALSGPDRTINYPLTEHQQHLWTFIVDTHTKLLELIEVLGGPSMTSPEDAD